MLRGIARLLVLAGMLTLVLALAAQARPRTKRQFVETYPKTRATRLDACGTCHDVTPPALNPYGNALLKANLSFKAIEKADSDKDGASNIAEIAALSFPGDPKDRPAAAKRDSAVADSAKTDTTAVLPDSTRQKR